MNRTIASNAAAQQRVATFQTRQRSLRVRLRSAPAWPVSAEPDRAAARASTMKVRATEAAPAPAASSTDALKLQLMSLCAGTNRGTLAPLARRRRIQRVLEGLSTPTAPIDAQLLSGNWELVYSTAEPFSNVYRSSPFFWAFQQGLVQDVDISAAIFAFTDAIPGADVGTALQRIDLAAGTLVSSVRLTVFPNISGDVVTRSSVAVEGNTLKLVVNSTEVEGSMFPFLDGFQVPVQQALERVRGAGATQVQADVLFLDGDMRVMRTQDDELFVYSKLA